MKDSASSTEAAIAELPCWSGPVTIAPLEGGITNRNFLVKTAGECFVVRLGADNPLHGISRANELAAARAGFAAGISPEVIYAAPGLMVSRFIAGRVLAEADFAEAAIRDQAAALLKRCHMAMAEHLDIPAVLFWVFHVNRAYLRRLRAGSCRIAERLNSFAALNAALERRLGPVTLAFCHNDLLAANWLHDGERLWLIDWDYAGFNTPLFDLANLAANVGLTPQVCEELLAAYDGVAPDPARFEQFAALFGASLLRELLWSAVSEKDPPIAFDYAAYTEANTRRLESALETFGLAACTPE